jgi:hypothetical protein
VSHPSCSDVAPTYVTLCRNHSVFAVTTTVNWGHVVAQLFEALRYEGSIPESVNGIFHWHNHFCRILK